MPGIRVTLGSTFGLTVLAALTAFLPLRTRSTGTAVVAIVAAAVSTISVFFFSLTFLFASLATASLCIFLSALSLAAASLGDIGFFDFVVEVLDAAVKPIARASALVNPRLLSLFALSSFAFICAAVNLSLDFGAVAFFTVGFFLAAIISAAFFSERLPYSSFLPIFLRLYAPLSLLPLPNFFRFLSS